MMLISMPHYAAYAADADDAAIDTRAATLMPP